MCPELEVIQEPRAILGEMEIPGLLGHLDCKDLLELVGILDIPALLESQVFRVHQDQEVFRDQQETQESLDQQVILDQRAMLDSLAHLDQVEILDHRVRVDFQVREDLLELKGHLERKDRQVLQVTLGSLAMSGPLVPRDHLVQTVSQVCRESLVMMVYLEYPVLGVFRGQEEHLGLLVLQEYQGKKEILDLLERMVRRVQLVRKALMVSSAEPVQLERPALLVVPAHLDSPGTPVHRALMASWVFADLRAALVLRARLAQWVILD